MRLSSLAYLLCTLVLFASTSCDDGDPIVPQSDTALCVLEPDALDFGIVEIGHAAQAKVRIHNRGTGTMAGSVEVDPSEPCDGFSIVSGTGAFSLRPGAIQDVRVEFDPASTGDKSCRIELGLDGCGVVYLVGRAENPPECSVEPSRIDFGTVPPGTVRTGSFMLTNTGGSFLEGIVEAICPDVSILSGAGAYRLGTGENKLVTFEFRPSAGAISCTISVGQELCRDVTITGFSAFPAFAATAIGFNGTILRSDDGGESWVRQSSGTSRNLTGMSFVDANVGTVVGQNGTILRTTDGGTSWVPQTSGVSESLIRVHFSDAEHGTIVGASGLILRTSDGGSTWTRQSSPSSEHLTNVYFADVMTGCAIGWNGTVVWTNDGGATWELRDAGTNRFLTGVLLFDASSGVIVTGRNTATGFATSQLLRTSDGGRTWIITEPAPDVHFNDLAFADPLTGVLIGASGEILRTENGGASWQPQTSGLTNLNGVSLLNPQVGVAVGFGGNIIETVNGGANWVSRVSGTADLLNRVQVVQMR